MALVLYCIVLAYLNCRNNQLTELDLSACPRIGSERVRLNDNPLKLVDLRNCSFAAETLNNLFEQLPTYVAADTGVIYIHGNPGTASWTDPADKKGWKIDKDPK